MQKMKRAWKKKRARKKKRAIKPAEFHLQRFKLLKVEFLVFLKSAGKARKRLPRFFFYLTPEKNE